MSTIEETFLANENPEYEEDKLKKRGSANSFTYQRKFKCVKNDANFSQEIRKPLTPLQYMTLKEQKEDKNFKTVTRERINFTHNSKYILPYPALTPSTCTTTSGRIWCTC